MENNKQAKYELLTAWVNDCAKEFTPNRGAKAANLKPNTTRNILHALAKAGLLEQRRKEKSLVCRKTVSWEQSKAVEVNAKRLKDKYSKRKTVKNKKAKRAKKTAGEQKPASQLGLDN